MSGGAPPRLAARVLAMLAADEPLLEDLLDALRDGFDAAQIERGRVYANCWYWRESVRAITPVVLETVARAGALRVAWRALLVVGAYAAAVLLILRTNGLLSRALSAGVSSSAACVVFAVVAMMLAIAFAATAGGLVHDDTPQARCAAVLAAGIVLVGGAWHVSTSADPAPLWFRVAMLGCVVLGVTAGSLRRRRPLAWRAGALSALALAPVSPHGLHAQTTRALAASSLCSRAVDARSVAAVDTLRLHANIAPGARVPDLPVDFYVGCLALANGRAPDASAAFERAAAAMPTDPVTRLWRGRALGVQAQSAFVLRQLSLARRTRDAFDEAIAVGPAFAAAHEARLQFALQAPSFLGGGATRAQVEAEQLERLDAHRGRLARLAIARHGRDDPEIIRLLELIVAAHPDSTVYQSALVAARERLRSRKPGQ